MPEAISVILDDRNDGRKFDLALRGTLKDGGDPTVIVKNNGTVEGRPIVMVTFSVQLPNGQIARAQTVTTARSFIMAGAMLAAKFPELTRRGEYPTDPSVKEIGGEHRGHRWSATLMEEMYLVAFDSGRHIGVAGSEKEAAAVAGGLIDAHIKQLKSG